MRSQDRALFYSASRVKSVELADTVFNTNLGHSAAFGVKAAYRWKLHDLVVGDVELS